jgi:hypothetical protein
VNDDIETWTRFMSAALAAAPHAPIDTLAARADEALAEYRQRRDSGKLAGRADRGARPSGTTEAPFVAVVGDGSVRYEPTSTAPDDEEIDSPLKPTP